MIGMCACADGAHTERVGGEWCASTLATIRKGSMINESKKLSIATTSSTKT